MWHVLMHVYLLKYRIGTTSVLALGRDRKTSHWAEELGSRSVARAMSAGFPTIQEVVSSSE